MLAFGLTAATGTFTPNNRAPAIANRTALRTFPEGPEGLLYKTISSFREAAALGGLLIYSSRTSNRWMIMVGKTLNKSLSTNRLGKYAGFVPGSRFLKFVRRPSYDGININNNVTEFGGDLYPQYTDMNYFAADDDLVYVGIVTSADDGYGHGAIFDSLSYAPLLNGTLGNCSIGLTYLSTTLPMTTPFQNYLKTTKVAALALVPDSVRGFYEKSFDGAVSTFTGKDARATIVVPSLWRGTVAINTYHARPKRIVQSLGGGGWGFSAATVIGSPPLTSAGVNGPWTGWSVRTHIKAGYCGIAGGTDRPFMGIYDGLGNDDFQSGLAVQGKIGPLRAGLIKDGHALERSVGRGILYDTAPDTMTTLDMLVNNQLDKFNDGTRDPATFASTTVDLAEVELNLAAGGGEVLRSVFDQGTLTQLLGSFSTHWDGLAKAAAKAGA